MNIKDYYNKYLLQKDQYLENIKSEYHTRLDKARDDYKIAVHYDFSRDTIMKQLQVISAKLGIYTGFVREISEYCGKNSKEISAVFNERIDKIKSNERDEILSLLSEVDAYSLMWVFWHEQTNVLKEKFEPRVNFESEESESHISPLIWKSENETEFVHFIYALYDIGYLSNEKDEKIKLVEQVAKAFNFDLTKNWQSKRSKSIEKSNHDYLPELIKKLTEAFEKSKKEKQAKKNKTSST